MHPITTVHYLALSAALLLIGTVGVLTRRNIVIILMSIELILNAVNINLIAFSHALQNVNGQVFAIFVIVDAVAEAAVLELGRGPPGAVAEGGGGVAPVQRTEIRTTTRSWPHSAAGNRNRKMAGP